MKFLSKTPYMGVALVSLLPTWNTYLSNELLIL